MKAVLDVGHQVIGIEGSQTAIEAFFNENNIPYEIEKAENNQYQIYKVNQHEKFFHIFLNYLYYRVLNILSRYTSLISLILMREEFY